MPGPWFMLLSSSACPEIALSESRRLAYRPDFPESGELTYLGMLKKIKSEDSEDFDIAYMPAPQDHFFRAVVIFL